MRINRVVIDNKKTVWTCVWGLTNVEKPYLSDEGMSNRCALPLSAQKMLHVSCRIGNSEVVIYYFLCQSWELNMIKMQDVINWSPAAFPQNLSWTQALQQTESVLWWASPTERNQGLPTCRPVGRHPPGPSSQAARGTCVDWRCRTEAVDAGSHVVPGGGSFRS